MRTIGVLALLLIAACSKYDAEIGYREGEKQRFDYWGNFASLDECRDAAIARYNAVNRESPGRAFSWACMKKNSDGGYASRHR